jgi:hypothetical protein
MSAHAVSARQPPVERLARSIVLRARGHVHGVITRLVSPGDLGQFIKPFVFLDYFEGEPANALQLVRFEGLAQNKFGNAKARSRLRSRTSAGDIIGRRLEFGLILRTYVLELVRSSWAADIFSVVEGKGYPHSKQKLGGE